MLPAQQACGSRHHGGRSAGPPEGHGPRAEGSTGVPRRASGRGHRGAPASSPTTGIWRSGWHILPSVSKRSTWPRWEVCRPRALCAGSGKGSISTTDRRLRRRWGWSLPACSGSSFTRAATGWCGACARRSVTRSAGSCENPHRTRSPTRHSGRVVAGAHGARGACPRSCLRCSGSPTPSQVARAQDTRRDSSH